MEAPEPQANRTRDSHGHYATEATTALRDVEALKLRIKGVSFRDIATQLGISASTAHDAVNRALAAQREEPAEQVRALEVERLDAMYEAVIKVLERQHFTVSNGRVIYVGKESPEPLLDDAPVLAAVDRLLKIQARRAALLGLDMPTKVEQSGTLTYQIVGVDTEAL